MHSYSSANGLELKFKTKRQRLYSHTRRLSTDRRNDGVDGGVAMGVPPTGVALFVGVATAFYRQRVQRIALAYCRQRRGERDKGSEPGLADAMKLASGTGRGFFIRGGE